MKKEGQIAYEKLMYEHSKFDPNNLIDKTVIVGKKQKYGPINDTEQATYIGCYNKPLEIRHPINGDYSKCNMKAIQNNDFYFGVNDNNECWNNNSDQPLSEIVKGDEALLPEALWQTTTIKDHTLVEENSKYVMTVMRNNVCVYRRHESQLMNYASGSFYIADDYVGDFEIRPNLQVVQKDGENIYLTNDPLFSKKYINVNLSISDLEITCSELNDCVGFTVKQRPDASPLFYILTSLDEKMVTSQKGSTYYEKPKTERVLTLQVSDEGHLKLLDVTGELKNKPNVIWSTNKLVKEKKEQSIISKTMLNEIDKWHNTSINTGETLEAGKAIVSNNNKYVLYVPQIGDKIFSAGKMVFYHYISRCVQNDDDGLFKGDNDSLALYTFDNIVYKRDTNAIMNSDNLGTPFHVNNTGDCLNACNQTEKCAAFTMDTNVYTNCQLKSEVNAVNINEANKNMSVYAKREPFETMESVSAGNLFYISDDASGNIQATPYAPNMKTFVDSFREQREKYYKNENAKESDASDLKMCKQSCLDVDTCGGVSYNPKTNKCHTFDEFIMASDIISDSNWNTYIRDFKVKGDISMPNKVKKEVDVEFISNLPITGMVNMETLGPNGIIMKEFHENTRDVNKARPVELAKPSKEANVMKNTMQGIKAITETFRNQYVESYQNIDKSEELNTTKAREMNSLNAQLQSKENLVNSEDFKLMAWVTVSVVTMIFGYDLLKRTRR